MPHQPILSVTIARNGHVLITQGFCHPALIILRDNIPRFLNSAESCPFIIIPPFGSSALACYVDNLEIDSIRLASKLGLLAQPGVLVKLRSRVIAYTPNPDVVADAQLLSQHGIDVIVTPQSMASVHRISGVPTISILARLSAPETVDSAEVFAFPVNMICEAVEEAIAHTKILIYEN